MTAFKGDNLTGRVIVDGNSYERCQFKDVTLIYTGGQPPTLDRCSFDGIAIEFVGPAAQTLEFLAKMQGGGFSAIIEPTLDMIRAAKAG